MIQSEVTIRMEPLEDGLFIWAEDELGTSVPPSQWLGDAFVWHASSYYGTMLEEWKTGLRLNALQALEYLAKQPASSFAGLRLSTEFHDVQEPLAAAWQDYGQGSFLPDMEGWGSGRLWKPASTELADNFTARLFADAVTETLRHPPSSGEWERAQRLYENREFVRRQREMSVSETDWLRKIGYTEDDMPFTIGLRLLEPQEEFASWKLETILMPKRGAARTYVYTDEASLPKRWKAHHERILETYAGWEMLVPWLMEDGRLRQELYEQEAWRFLTEASNELLTAGVDILLPSWWQALKQHRLSLRAKVKGDSARGQAFFGMHTIVSFDWRISTEGVDLSEAEFRSLVEQNRRLININGQWIKLDPEFIAQVKKLMDKAERQGLEMKDLLQRELLRTADEQEHVEEDNVFNEIEIELDSYYEGLLHRLTEIGRVPKREVPETLHAELRPYQQLGVEWLLHLRELGFGALLADDMGLGKTLQTIAYLAYMKAHEGSGKPALIVAPTSVLGNWQREFERFAPDLRVALYYGGSRPKGEEFLPFVQNQDVILTSYTLAHLDEEELSSYLWNAVILDEAQNIKNAQTKQSRAVRGLRAQHKLALTGTPMENRLTELWAIFDFLNRGYLGSLSQFQRRFVAPIEKDHDKERIEQIQRLIAPFLLRRTKQDPDVALNLPDKQEQKEFCALTAEQASLYEQLVQDTLANVAGLSGIERRGFILMMLNKLKQICDHPALYLKEAEPKDVTGRSLKMEKLLDLMETIRDRDESCLIFTQYIRMGDMLKQVLEEKTGEPVLFLNGSVRKQERDAMIEQFQSGRYKIFILSIKAGGTGLNLTAANHVIHFDRWWNPAVENQATDRAYRIGQKRFVHVHKLITTGTLEEKIDEMLERKQSLNNAIITSDNWMSELSMEELQELLGV
ncbi:DEAD/DEAH box helicase [Ectobacillus ponti]|uniref:DEAD/DEAH box helicase n=1 Tax=Ectobacillus ponti TaxID=2961894 RepID=A0AA41X7G3_9BACI|nr:DEAD/DEAH box helicase [Ectobacillus ponti]MCP8967710.1 DEAD/DEAH box helicase [Ectobacillus ponti]